MANPRTRPFTVPPAARPAWADVPSLAWLAVKRLSSKVIHLPVIGLIAFAAAWPATVIVFAGAQAEHRLATYRGGAVLLIKPLYPRRTTAQAVRCHGVKVLCAVLALVVLLAEALIIALAVALLTGLTGLGLFAAAGWVLVSGILGVIATKPPSGIVAAPAYRESVRHARRSGIPLVEVASLAAASAHPRAVTALSRRLMRQADADGITVVARARNRDLAAIYLRLQFEHADGHPLILIRHPRSPGRRLS